MRDYLCPGHREQLRQDPALALSLWKNAMDNGHGACDVGDWASARQFVGAAYQTALLHLGHRQPVEPGLFRASHLLDSGRALSLILRKLQCWEEAQLCLLTLQNFLMARGGSSACTRARTLALTESLIEQLMAGGDAINLTYTEIMSPLLQGSLH